MSDEVTDAGYDEWIDALAAGDGYALACPAGHHSLPPQRRCPTCARSPLESKPLTDTGIIETYSIVHIPTPAFTDDAPYVIAIASFGDVRLTGQVRSFSPEEVTSGISVVVDVDERATTGDPLVIFHPV